MNRLRAVWRDERGVGYFAPLLVVTLALVAVACLGLLVDGGRITSARRTADQTAFQAARAAAQHVDEVALRAGSITVTDDAHAAAADTVARLLAASGRTGRMTGLTIDGSQVTVTVTIDQPLTAATLFGRSTATVTGSGTVRVGAGVTSEETPLP